MRLGILGGTFDPIHLGHLLLAEAARETLALRRVLFTPAGESPLKQDVDKTPACHRQAMVELAIAGHACFELSQVDLARPGPHYTVDTIRLIRAQYNLSADECFFIIGGDSLVSLPLWHQAEILITLCRLAVSHRPGYQPDLTALEAALPGLKERLEWVDMPALNLEASEIRARVKAGRSIRYQVTNSVREYIQQYGLYRREEPCNET
ncbi:MAG: nicotinate (nicotinamide) nucleotide adenylyltransferase [Anaerolineae bacterium]|nr:nicotinate (nicotinamide) nucleotide adenylyltransferase [Anaerolineae bacterium]